MKNTYIYLCNGSQSSKKFHDKLLNRIHKITASLDPKKRYKSKDLYGKKSWKMLSVAERSLVESCMCNFAINQLAMLDFVGTSSNNFALFKLA